MSMCASNWAGNLEYGLQFRVVAVQILAHRICLACCGGSGEREVRRTNSFSDSDDLAKALSSRRDRPDPVELVTPLKQE
jgi:hypothetical protein